MAPGGLAMTGGTGCASDEPSRTGNRRWDTSPLSMASPNDRTPVAIPMLAPIPSPLARFSWSDARHLERVDERASTGVRELFGRVRQVDSQRDGRFDLRLAVLVGSLPMIAPLTIERESGFVAYLERKKQDMAEEEQSLDFTSFQLRYEWITDNNHFIRLDAVQPLPYQRSAQPGQPVPCWASHLDIRRLSSINSAADTIQRFFIYNSANTPLRVNGVMYGTNAILGPLPDFAVIEVGETAVLWWHTDESIDYLPSLRDELEESKKHPLSIGEDYINLSNTRPSKKQKLEEGKLLRLDRPLRIREDGLTGFRIRSSTPDIFTGDLFIRYTLKKSDAVTSNSNGADTTHTALETETYLTKAAVAVTSIGSAKTTTELAVTET